MSEERDANKKEGERLMWSGVGLGAISVVSTAVLGATCPLCVVGAPALVGWGAYKRWKATSPDEPEPESELEEG